jgi:hypothetical protein
MFSPLPLPKSVNDLSSNGLGQLSEQPASAGSSRGEAFSAFACH